jgi:GntR family transcriptional repressor for pyruvate dehydrogenase complex
MTTSGNGGAAAPSFRSIRRVPAAAGEVISTIKAMILNGELAPHQRLPSEKELAEALGVSRPTIREAVRGLMTLNIVESRHGDGTYVTSLEPRLLAAPIDFLLRVEEQSLTALTEARIVLESGMAEFAAAKATPEHLKRLSTLVTTYGKSIDDVERCIELDRAFHEELANAADSPILSSMLSTVTALSAQSRTRTAQSRRMRVTSHSDHEAIAAAVAAHDPVVARAAMQTHLDHVLKVVAPKRKSAARA